MKLLRKKAEKSKGAISLESSELARFKAANQRCLDIKLALGELAVRKEMIMNEMRQALIQREIVDKELSEKYGAGSEINTETGEVMKKNANGEN